MFVAEPGNEPGTSGSRVRRATDCATWPGHYFVVSNIIIIFVSICATATVISPKLFILPDKNTDFYPH